MSVLWVVLGIVAVILLPILIGLMFAIIIGGPIYLLMKGFEYLMFFVINPIIAKIRAIPFIGWLLCFSITTCIGVPLISVVITFICIPTVCIIARAITGGNI